MTHFPASILRAIRLCRPNNPFRRPAGSPRGLVVRRVPGPFVFDENKFSMTKPPPKPFHNKKPKRERRLEGQATTEDVLQADVQDLLQAHQAADDGVETATTPSAARPEQFSEIEVQIEMISSTGDGLGFSSSKDYVYVVPFTSPGDKVLAKVITHFPKSHYALTDFVKVIQPGPLRDDERIKCPYFARCSGCQFQMMSYEDQLAHKKTIVERAYKHFSNLTPESIPAVEDTMASPLQYGYRTKLTPHFDGPRNARRNNREGKPPTWDGIPPIGFMVKGTRKTIDIEDCPIGTDAVRAGMKSERERVGREINAYRKGATILLRESTKRVYKDEAGKDVAQQDGSAGSQPGSAKSKWDLEASKADLPPARASGSERAYEDIKTCVTDNNALSTEYVGNSVFVSPAGAFFQNNNSILPNLVDYIRKLILSPADDPSAPPIEHLIDAYCGSGFFTIALSSLNFASSTGIDISSSSIECAQKNAELNNLDKAVTKFKAADASGIFTDVTTHPDQTVVIIDPPRKGSDKPFLEQLLRYGPRRIVYVSCNVHTQARDVAVLVEGQSAGQEEGKRTRYKVKSIRGLDFFPQTGHVESVALLERE